ncbi:MAG: hypothetical protein ACO25F_08580 [Erythrobacter sp.]
MQKIILLTSILALAACAKPAEEAPAPAAEETASAAPTAVDGGPVAGTYNVEGPDGAASVWALAEDGTFTLTAEGVDPVTGTYTSEGDTFCADPEGEEAAEVCYKQAIGDDGTWTSTDPDGGVSKVARAAN